jgi:hypothetical protein
MPAGSPSRSERLPVDLRRAYGRDNLDSSGIHHRLLSCRLSNWPAGKHKGARRAVNEEGQSIQIPLAWIGVEEVPIFFANQAVVQFQQNEFILTFGQMSPPAILGSTEEERAEQAEEIPYVPVKPLARLGLTEARMRELIALLEVNLRNYEQYQQQIRGGGQWPNM